MAAAVDDRDDDVPVVLPGLRFGRGHRLLGLIKGYRRAIVTNTFMNGGLRRSDAFAAGKFHVEPPSPSSFTSLDHLVGAGEQRLIAIPTKNGTDHTSNKAPYVPVRQCCSNFGRGVPRTAIAPTTSSQNGSTPKPGIASRANPGNRSHCRPSTMNSSSAVPRSTTHTIGGKGVAKAPMASEMPAMAKARASRFLENLRVFEIGVPALIGCLLGSVGGGVIRVWSAVIGSLGVIFGVADEHSDPANLCRLLRPRRERPAAP